MLNHLNATALSSHGSLVLPLDQSLIRSGESWAITAGARDQLTKLQARLIPLPKKQLSRVSDSANARWCDVEIRFRDGETVSVRIGQVREVSELRTAWPDRYPQ